MFWDSGGRGEFRVRSVCFPAAGMSAGPVGHFSLGAAVSAGWVQGQASGLVDRWCLHGFSVEPRVSSEFGLGCVADTLSKPRIGGPQHSWRFLGEPAGSHLHRTQAFRGRTGCFQLRAEQECTRALERTILFEKEMMGGGRGQKLGTVNQENFMGVGKTAVRMLSRAWSTWKTSPRQPAPTPPESTVSL